MLQHLCSRLAIWLFSRYSTHHLFAIFNSKLLIRHSFITCFAIFLYQESSVIHSNANLGVHGQGLLNLSGPGDWIEAQRLVLSLFYSIHVSGCLTIAINDLCYLCWLLKLVWLWVIQ